MDDAKTQNLGPVMHTLGTYNKTQNLCRRASTCVWTSLGNSAVREKKDANKTFVFRDPLLVAHPLILCLLLKGGWELTPTIKDPTPPAPCDREMFKFVITVTPCFTMGKSQGWGTFPKSRTRLGNRLVLGLLI
jgi:hypothetical protein